MKNKTDNAQDFASFFWVGVVLAIIASVLYGAFRLVLWLDGSAQAALDLGALL